MMQKLFLEVLWKLDIPQGRIFYEFIDLDVRAVFLLAQHSVLLMINCKMRRL